MTRTNGPWTPTSDDCYIYQLSLVVAIASISFDSIALRDTTAAVLLSDGKEGCSWKSPMGNVLCWLLIKSAKLWHLNVDDSPTGGWFCNPPSDISGNILLRRKARTADAVLACQIDRMWHVNNTSDITRGVFSPLIWDPERLDAILSWILGILSFILVSFVTWHRLSRPTSLEYRRYHGWFRISCATCTHLPIYVVYCTNG